LNVLDAMVRHDTKFFSSTCATYGIPHRVPLRETAPQVPINPYGRSKLACGQIIKDVAAAHDLRLAMLHYFNAAEQILTATWSSGMIPKRTSSLSPWMPQAAMAPRRRFLEGTTRPRTELPKGFHSSVRFGNRPM
jgi:UDP-glucose 4-epimerase